jgi:hypothetical protein
MASRIYIETFDDGPGGWKGWINNFDGPKRLESAPSILISRSPWWVDYNHAPPGAGYLHMLFCLSTKGPGFGEADMEAGGTNRFVESSFPTDFRNARISVRMRGELEARGAQVVLLAQGSVDGLTSGWALRASPIEVKDEWTEQSITVTSDERSWECLGARHDRTKSYGKIILDQILSEVNNGIMFIMFPLNVVPMGPISGNPHLLRAGKDYPIWTSRLPEGYVMLDEVRIEFPTPITKGGATSPSGPAT